jgi:TRAP-type C4-dicarboxylate transport system permease small subunit
VLASFEKLAAAFRWAESALLILLFSATLGTAAFQVLARNIADTGLAGGESFVRVMVLWITMVGALVASRHDTHIRIDVVAHLLGERGRSRLRWISAWFTAAVAFVLAWYSAQFVLVEYEDGQVAFGAVPVWVCELVMPIGFGLMGARYLVHALRPP